MSKKTFKNPFRPGAGHTPPYLAGRETEKNEFLRLLQQDVVLENMILTGLRGVGKTVLLDTFKPLAIQEGWSWVGTDLSESASINEESISIRLLTDMAVVTSGIVVSKREERKIGFASEKRQLDLTLNYHTLARIFAGTPGLIADKLKRVLEIVWVCMNATGRKGLVFAYDEAQNLSDQAEKEQYPLSILLDAFQSIQRKGIPFMLLLTGLPTLFPKLVEARTYSERMFHVVFLRRLNEEESRDAIIKPVEDVDCPIRLNHESAEQIIRLSGGYPYFIQFICREAYDAFLQKQDLGEKQVLPTDEIVRKLDTDFFAGRWSRATDRQRELLEIAAKLSNSDTEFTVQDIVTLSRSESKKPFSNSGVNQILSSLSGAGLVYKNRYGKYSFAVPLMGQFIFRQIAERSHG